MEKQVGQLRGVVRQSDVVLLLVKSEIRVWRLISPACLGRRSAYDGGPVSTWTGTVEGTPVSYFLLCKYCIRFVPS